MLSFPPFSCLLVLCLTHTTISIWNGSIFGGELSQINTLLHHHTGTRDIRSRQLLRSDIFYSSKLQHHISKTRYGLHTRCFNNSSTPTTTTSIPHQHHHGIPQFHQLSHQPARQPTFSNSNQSTTKLLPPRSPPEHNLLGLRHNHWEAISCPFLSGFAPSSASCSCS